MEDITKFLGDLFKFKYDFEKLLDNSKILIIALIISYTFYFISKYIIKKFVVRFINKTKTNWDDYYMKKGIFDYIAYLIPLITFNLIIENQEFYNKGLDKIIKLIFVVIIVKIIQVFLNASEDIYNTFKIARERPIKSYIQTINIFVFLAAFVVFLAIIFNKSPIVLLSGLGAMTAVLLLVFKDPILGFVASIQLASNNLVSLGDWIEMSSHGADGDVIEINLTNVKVQNWDKTIVTIPAYNLVSQPFKNWKGMESYGGRRIKRTLIVDVQTIKFLDETHMDRLKESKYLKEYLETKKEELTQYNTKENSNINDRKLTNVGTFRAYIENYLKSNSNIAKDKTILVRQLQSTEFGLPIEIYCFSNVTAWNDYEKIQSDIFDHLFSIISEFDLVIYQRPSGNDARNITKL